jgi:hypothetical protein
MAIDHQRIGTVKMIFRTAASRGLSLALLLAATGCSNLAKPGQQSIEGMTPVGTVSLTETIAVGAAGGKGILNFQGRSYPFKLVGGVTGGGGVSEDQDRNLTPIVPKVRCVQMREQIGKCLRITALA